MGRVGECPARINTDVINPLTVVSADSTTSSCRVLGPSLHSLGVSVIFSTGQQGNKCRLNRHEFVGCPRVVHLTIIEARVKELRDLADEALLHNLVSRKLLESFAIEASSFA